MKRWSAVERRLCFCFLLTAVVTGLISCNSISPGKSDSLAELAGNQQKGNVDSRLASDPEYCRTFLIGQRTKAGYGSPERIAAINAMNDHEKANAVQNEGILKKVGRHSGNGALIILDFLALIYPMMVAVASVAAL